MNKNNSVGIIGSEFFSRIVDWENRNTCTLFGDGAGLTRGAIATIHNYPYYAEHLEKYGYSKDIDWVEYEIKILDKVPEKVERIAWFFLKKNKFEILKVSRIKEMKPYMVELIKIYINHNFEKAESNPELETNCKVQSQWKFLIEDNIKEGDVL